MMTYFSDFLFARPSFWREFGRIADLMGVSTEFNSSLTTKQADYFATKADWQAVGHDLRFAMDELKSEVAEAEAKVR